MPSAVDPRLGLGNLGVNVIGPIGVAAAVPFAGPPLLPPAGVAPIAPMPGLLPAVPGPAARRSDLPPANPESEPPQRRE